VLGTVSAFISIRKQFCQRHTTNPTGEIQMTIKYALKAGCAALALAGMASANAGLFYLDIGTNFDTTGLGKVLPTSTSVKDSIQYKYDSNTFIADTDASGSISIGDLLTTTAGLAVNGVTMANLVAGNNSITNFLPSQVGPNQSNNGYGPKWSIGFSATGLKGHVTGVIGGVPMFAYDPVGQIQLYVTTDFLTMTNFMNIDITGGGATGVSTILNGKVDFTGIASTTYENLFHSGTASCGGSSGFFDIWTGCGKDMPISFSSTQDTNVMESQFIAVAGGRDISTNHNGSATFDIPEPGSLALLGLALAGLGMTQRRRKQV
jgi:PEP-CTERM motif